jgi:uncharacterized membrane protein YgcG
MSLIKGTLQTSKTNDYGYTSIKVGGQWYGGDKKGDIKVGEGELVEVEVYENNKGFKTYKSQSLKKVAGSKPAEGPVNKGPTASKDEYWAAKEARDAAVEPRINYFAALDRAITFVDVALRNGALVAFTKAKDPQKLDVLIALVGETTQRMIKEAYEQSIPTKGVGKASSGGDSSGGNSGGGEGGESESGDGEDSGDGEGESWS